MMVDGTLHYYHKLHAHPHYPYI